MQKRIYLIWSLLSSQGSKDLTRLKRSRLTDVQQVSCTASQRQHIVNANSCDESWNRVKTSWSILTVKDTWR